MNLNVLTDSDLLKFAIENGMLDVNSIQEQMRINERRKVLENHPYKIWQGNDKKWRTYLPDANSDRGSKMIKRSSRYSLEDCIVEYYEENKGETVLLEQMTMRQMFDEWIKYKKLHTPSDSYISRVLADWKKFYLEDEIIDIPIKDLTKLQLDIWAHTKVEEYNMTKKCYCNMSLIIRQMLDYAMDLGIIDINYYRAIRMSKKCFCRVKKKTSETEIYSIEEQVMICNDMLRRYKDNPLSTAPIAIILDFELGLRVGELCALKFSDIEGDYIHIQRQEVDNFEYISSTKMKRVGTKVVEYTKSEDGDREILLTNEAKNIIKYLKENDVMRIDGYMFHKADGTNITKMTIGDLLLKSCRLNGIKMKSSHKIRKTFISLLIDGGLNIDEIRKMVGHADEKTTYNSYCFNTKTRTETRKIIENALRRGNQGNQSILRNEIQKVSV